MQRWKPVLFNLVFSLNCLLLFLVAFEAHLSVPPWLQVVGRMHPLVLHFPIVLLVLSAFWELLPRRQKEETVAWSRIGDGLLLLAALSAVFTSLVGLFLSREDGYEPAVLAWHKWGGVAISLLSLLWYSFREKVRQVKAVLVVTTAVCLTGIIITGHQGANITHGENFLLAPLQFTEEPIVLLEDAVVYTHMVKPILTAKCMSCHNQQKAKGELLMETESALLKGGKSGLLWDTTEKDLGLLFQRIHLPLNNKKHMPPKGKPQLTEEEMAILYHWVKTGASFTQKVTALAATDTLRLLAENHFSTMETDMYNFAAADEKDIKTLNTAYRVITPLATGSPALAVEFFSAQKFDPASLEDLLRLKEQIVSVNLSKMPVGDAHLQTLAQFTNLRKLNLSFTNVKGERFQELLPLKELRHLSLSGTRLRWSHLQPLLSLPRLSRLYLWNTAVSSAELAAASRQYKSIQFESGFKGDTVTMKLNPPLLENKEQVITGPVPLRLKHVIKGTTVRFTTDGTEPDSLRSPAFESAFLVDKNLVIKAKAFKPGWISSDVVEHRFFKAGFRPDSVVLLKAPDPLYKGDGGATLMDTQKGDLNFRSGKWVGYKDSPLTALFQFQQPVTLSSVTVSTLTDINSYIMPPQQVEIWGGRDKNNLHLLQRIRPQQPVEMKGGQLQGYDLSFVPKSVQWLRLVVTPVAQLPAWHPGKGQKGWVFVDEVFVN